MQNRTNPQLIQDYLLAIFEKHSNAKNQNVDNNETVDKVSSVTRGDRTRIFAKDQVAKLHNEDLRKEMEEDVKKKAQSRKYSSQEILKLSTDLKLEKTIGKYFTDTIEPLFNDAMLKLSNSKKFKPKLKQDYLDQIKKVYETVTNDLKIALDDETLWSKLGVTDPEKIAIYKSDLTTAFLLSAEYTFWNKLDLKKLSTKQLRLFHTTLRSENYSYGGSPTIEAAYKNLKWYFQPEQRVQEMLTFSSQKSSEFEENFIQRLFNRKEQIGILAEDHKKALGILSGFLTQEIEAQIAQQDDIAKLNNINDAAKTLSQSAHKDLHALFDKKTVQYIQALTKQRAKEILQGKHQSTRNENMQRTSSSNKFDKMEIPDLEQPKPKGTITKIQRQEAQRNLMKGMKFVGGAFQKSPSSENEPAKLTKSSSGEKKQGGIPLAKAGKTHSADKASTLDFSSLFTKKTSRESSPTNSPETSFSDFNEARNNNNNQSPQSDSRTPTRESSDSNVEFVDESAPLVKQKKK